MASGLHYLRRYFELIIFQWYLSSVRPDTLQEAETFESFVEKHPGEYMKCVILS